MNTITIDAWVRWTYLCNGWQWSIFRGAELLAEGSERSESVAYEKARAALAKAT